MDRVSVLINSHDASAFIGAAIESALAQTHRPSQILVVDDSTDDSPRIVTEYVAKAPGIVELKRVPPCNIAQARNVSLDHATGDFISFLDADDLWLPTKTQKQLAILHESPQAVGCYSPYFDFQNDLDDMQRKVPREGKDNPALRDVIFDQNTSSSTVLIRRSAIGELRFDEQRPDGDDTMFMSELRLVGSWRMVNEPLIAKRIHPGQASCSNKHRVKNVNNRLLWIHRNAGRIGVDNAQSMHDDLAAGFVRWIESCYWRRDLGDLKWLCEQARMIAPQAFAKSFLATRRIYPRWVYRLRDWLGAKPSNPK